jgi:hypothetical protein
MANWINLLEFDIPPAGGQPDAMAGGPPMSQPGGPGDPMGQKVPPNLNNPAQMKVNMPTGGTEDINDDPQYPDMPPADNETSFEQWKMQFVKDTIKGDPNLLLNSLVRIRDRDLDPKDRKFVEDNVQICFLRRNPAIFEASSEIRKAMKKEFDQTTPGVRTVEHIVEVLDRYPLLNEVYVKASGLCIGKADAHRKFVASLIGAFQVGVGAQEEDLVFEEVDYSIRISTRFNHVWGDVNLGRWSLKEDDPERYLEEDVLRRLEAGSPEEKDVIRRRVIIESIAGFYRTRSFIINVVGSDGTVYHMGWDLGSCLKTAFTDGKLVVRTEDSDTKDAFIDEEGQIIKIPRIAIYYVKESDEISPSGKAETEELEFISYRDGNLYLSAPLSLIKESAVSLNGITLKETPWQGNPSDLLRVKRCNPSSAEMLLRDC